MGRKVESDEATISVSVDPQGALDPYTITLLFGNSRG